MKIDEAAIGETGISCYIYTDTSGVNTARCYTISVTTAGTSYTLTASQGTQINTFTSSQPNQLSFNIFIQLKMDDWDFWNSTLYSGYNIVPYILDGNYYGSSVGINELYSNADYFSPIYIKHNCLEGYESLKSRNL